MSAIQRMREAKACDKCRADEEADYAADCVWMCDDCARIVALAAIPTEPTEGMTQAAGKELGAMFRNDRGANPDYVDSEEVRMQLRAALKTLREEVGK